MADTPLPRRSDLCRVMRETGHAFINSTDSPDRTREGVQLRSEMDCLFALWESEGFDPVATYKNLPDKNPSPPRPCDPAPLHA